MLNESHLKWCQQHDWGQDAKLEKGKIILSQNEYREKQTVIFSSFKALKTWAGY